MPLVGPLLVTIDRIHVVNLWTDFPDKLSNDEIQILREEAPYWYKFFSTRLTDRHIHDASQTTP